MLHCYTDENISEAPGVNDFNLFRLGMVALQCVKSVDGPHDSCSSQEEDCLAFIA